jgi:hypothetical protein
MIFIAKNMLRAKISRLSRIAATAVEIVLCRDSSEVSAFEF